MNGSTNLTDPSAFPSLAESSTALKDPTPHLSYMRNLQGRQPPPTLLEQFSAGYQDYLQAPLQPLTVNLESITYEVFEKDPIKYDWYEKAIARALSDWIAQRKPTSGTDGRIVVAVVGAGRGPLVTRALKAAASVGVDIDMWALEKNPNAFVLLQRNNETMWNHRVSLVKSDMRTWRGPVRHDDAERLSEMLDQSQSAMDMNYTGSADTDSTYLLATAARQATHYKVDIMISELLGSFGDNELSPECLDGVQHLLNPTHGISIPASYTAFISPIAAPKLYADITNSMVQTTPTATETPYVVMLNAIDHISTSSSSTGPSPPQGSSNRPESTDPRSITPQSPLTSNPVNPALPLSYAKAHTGGKASPSPTNPHHHHNRTSSTSLPASPNPIIHPCWSFQHPNSHLPSSPPSANTHNTRHTTLHFPIPHRAACHGLAGYFECVLYNTTISPSTASPTSPPSRTTANTTTKSPSPTPHLPTHPSVCLSTNPLTMPALSPDMMSWFPLFFPLKQPVWFPDESECVVNLWRREDGRKVWYEWMVEAWIRVADGKKMVKVGGSEVHSSEKEGCLM